MFGLKKRALRLQKKKEENNWRLENEIYRKIHDLENLFVKLDETKAKAKKEQNPYLKQVIANDYIVIENQIKKQTLSLKEMHKTYLHNQDFLGKEQLVNDYKMIDDFTISSLADLKKVTFKIKDIQEKRLKEDKERATLTDVFADNLDSYTVSLENDRAKQLVEQWTRESEEEQLTESEMAQNEATKTLESKEDL